MVEITSEDVTIDVTSVMVDSEVSVAVVPTV